MEEHKRDGEQGQGMEQEQQRSQDEQGQRKWGVTNFLREGQWIVATYELSIIRRIGLHALRLITLVVVGLRRNQCTLHAASLTFFSLMALVPVLVLTLALARTFGGAELAKEQVDMHLQGWLSQISESAEAVGGAEVAGGQETGEGMAGVEVADSAAMAEAFTTQVQEVVDQLFEQVNSISFGTLGGIGLVLLLWSVVSTLGKVESSFNQVWGVERARPLVRKIADYMFVIMILPFLIMAISTMPITSMIHNIVQKMGGGLEASFSAIGGLGLMRALATVVFGTLAFGFLLGFMPNTRVRTVPSMVGGFVTLILFLGWLKLCTMLQIGIGKYSVLYGGFAVLPILLFWLYVSWQLILLGSEIAFAVQNHGTYMSEQLASGASIKARLLLALALCGAAARRAAGEDGGPFAAEEFARSHRVPHRFVSDALEHLKRTGILAEVEGRPGEYLLCRCGHALTGADVARALFEHGNTASSLGMDSLGDSISGLGTRFDDSLAEIFGMSVAEISSD